MTLQNMRICAGFNTQGEVAQKIQVNRTLISKWESGIAYPRPTMLPQIAQLYNVTEGDIIAAITKARQQRGNSA